MPDLRGNILARMQRWLMGWSFVCPKNPLGPEWVDAAGLYQCSTCGKRHRAAETGLPAKRIGAPAIIKDKVAKHFDYACGRWITSESQRRRIYDKMGLVRRSMAENRRHHPTNTSRKQNVAITFAGQKDHRSAPEKHQTFKRLAGDSNA